jgi:hypothetical protein
MWTPENRPKYDRSTPHYPSDLTDEEWSIIALLLPREARRQQADDCSGWVNAGPPALPVLPLRRHAACRTRTRRNSKPARPYMARLSILIGRFIPRPGWSSRPSVHNSRSHYLGTNSDALRYSCTGLKGLVCEGACMGRAAPDLDSWLEPFLAAVGHGKRRLGRRSI